MNSESWHQVDSRAPRPCFAFFPRNAGVYRKTRRLVRFKRIDKSIGAFARLSHRHH